MGMALPLKCGFPLLSACRSGFLEQPRQRCSCLEATTIASQVPGWSSPALWRSGQQ